MSLKQPLSVLSLLDQIRSIALEGLKYGGNEYDKVRYGRLLEIASQTYADLLTLDTESLVSMFRKQIGINTPKVGVDVIYMNHEGRFLTLRRVDDGSWCLPGGWMDIGEGPALTAQRELQEEAGINARPLKIVMCIHKGPHLADYLYHQISLVIVMQPAHEMAQVTLSHEHTDFDWIDHTRNRVWHYGHDDILNKLMDYRNRTQDIFLEDYPDHIMI